MLPYKGFYFFKSYIVFFFFKYLFNWLILCWANLKCWSRLSSLLLSFASTTHFLNLTGIFEIGNQDVNEDA